MKKALSTLVVLLLGATAAPAEDWAKNMFNNGKDIAHDFGNVPRGAQLYHRFTITNIYAVPMEITDVKPGCSCTEAKASKRTLQPRESATIDVMMDATRFTGPKSVEVRVQVGPEFLSTAVLTVSANSRADLVFNPGEISFGTVTRGEAAEKTIEIDYAGAFDWKATELIAKDVPITVKLEKLERKAGQVGYRITATLNKDAPAGDFKQEIFVKTNDPTSPLVPIVVEATVQAPVTVTPNNLALGAIKVGEAVTKKVVVRGTKPFKVLGVDGLKDGLSLGNPLTDDEAKVQTVSIKIQPDKAGEIKREIKIRTSLQDTPLTVTIDGNAGQ